MRVIKVLPENIKYSIKCARHMVALALVGESMSLCTGTHIYAMG